MELVGLAIAALVALGLGLLAHLLLGETLDLALRLRQRFRPRRRRLLASLLRSEANTISDGGQVGKKRRWNPLPWLPAFGGLAGAILARDVLISPYLLLLGLGATWAGMKQIGMQTSGRLAEETGELVRAFRGIYAVSGSLYGSLEEAEGVLPTEGDLRAAVKRVIARYGAGDDDPLRPLKSLPDPSLRRFVRVLALIGQSDTQAIREALERLERQIVARKKLRNRVQVVLALMTGTLRILQGANLGAAAIAVTIPLWRDFFTATWGHRATFILATAGFALASAYFQTEKNALQEQAL